jgi:hypothetical protein
MSLHRSEARVASSGVPLALPPYVPGNLADADNAAVPLGEAIARMRVNMKENGGSVDAASMENADSAYVAGITALLRDAAGRKGFDPGPEPKTDEVRSIFYSEAVSFMASEAANLRKLHDTNGSLSLCLDGLRLERHLQSIPAEWSFSEHAATTREIFSVVEDALADERGASPDIVQKIAAQIDLPANFAYARQAILLQHLAQEKRMERFGGRMASVQSQGLLLRLILWTVGSQGSVDRVKADMIENDLRAKGALDGIAQGRWPTRADLDFRNGRMGNVSIISLAADTEELLVAQTALAICWQGLATGHLPSSFTDVKVAWWNGVPRSPIGDKPLQWKETRGVGTLSFPSDAPKPATVDDFDGMPDSISWRLPARPRDSS